MDPVSRTLGGVNAAGKSRPIVTQVQRREVCVLIAYSYKFFLFRMLVSSFCFAYSQALFVLHTRKLVLLCMSATATLICELFSDEILI